LHFELSPVINVHLERFGLKMHVGTVAKPSKTEFMVIPAHRNDAIDAADLAPVKADDEGGVVTSTDFFKYLGGGVDSVLTDNRDVDRSIKSAAGAFGAAEGDLQLEAHQATHQEGGIPGDRRQHTPLRRGVLPG
jgi:hypothetical protein